jgi:hypothetical protein
MGAGTQGAYCNPPWGYSEDRAAVLSGYPTLPYPTLPYPTLPYPTLPYPTLPYPTLPQCTHAYERSGARRRDGDRPAQRCPRRWAWARTSRSTRQCLSQKTLGTSVRCAARTHVAGKAAARLPRHPCYRAGYVVCEPTAPPGTVATYSASCTLAGHRGIPDGACRRTQSGIGATRY